MGLLLIVLLSFLHSYLFTIVFSSREICKTPQWYYSSCSFLLSFLSKSLLPCSSLPACLSRHTVFYSTTSIKYIEFEQSIAFHCNSLIIMIAIMSHIGNTSESDLLSLFTIPFQFII